jgi:hypothetical protein
MLERNGLYREVVRVRKLRASVLFLTLAIVMPTATCLANVPTTRPTMFGSPCEATSLRATIGRAEYVRWSSLDGGDVSRMGLFFPESPGYSVYDVRQWSLLDAIGVEPSDLIMRIQNMSLHRMQDLLALYSAARSGGSDTITVDLRRRGCPTRLVVSIVDLYPPDRP